jgi:hypothetical protein
MLSTTNGDDDPEKRDRSSIQNIWRRCRVEDWQQGVIVAKEQPEAIVYDGWAEIQSID